MAFTRMSDIPIILPKLTVVRVFSKLELKDTYYHVLIDNKSKKHTGFACEYKTAQYKVMPFGLKNAPLVC
jgi:hypothetical protein